MNYDEKNWLSIHKSLVNTVESLAFDAFTRARLISDMILLAYVGRLSYVTVFDTIQYLPLKDHYVHWKLLLGWFNRIRVIFFRTKFYKSFQVSPEV